MPVAEFASRIAHGAPGGFWTVFTVLAAAALAAFFGGLRRLRRARTIEDTPTSRIRSAAQGYVELSGYARLLPGPDIVSPLSGARCAWWRYKIEHLERSSDRQRSHWRVVEQGTSDEVFVLADASGECAVDPHRARTYPSLSRRWQGRTRRPAQVPEKSPWLSGGDFRYSEDLICIGDPLYAYGWFRTQSVAQSYDQAGDVRDLLREWKADRRDLLRRFDANGDGEIDLAEWEQARRAAEKQVLAEHVEQSAHPELHVLGHPPDGGDFILSTLSAHGLVRRLRWRGWIALVGGVLLGLGGAWLLVQRMA